MGHPEGGRRTQLVTRPPALFTRHRRVAKKVARGYFIPGADQDDVEKESMDNAGQRAKAKLRKAAA